MGIREAETLQGPRAAWELRLGSPDVREAERCKQKMETSVPSVGPHRVREVQPRRLGARHYLTVDLQDGGSQGSPVLRGVLAPNARLDADLDD
jgi:hypothetical protein